MINLSMWHPFLLGNLRYYIHEHFLQVVDSFEIVSSFFTSLSEIIYFETCYCNIHILLFVHCIWVHAFIFLSRSLKFFSLYVYWHRRKSAEIRNILERETTFWFEVSACGVHVYFHVAYWVRVQLLCTHNYIYTYNTY